MHFFKPLSSIIILLFSAHVLADDASGYSPLNPTSMTLCSDMVVNNNPRLTNQPVPNPLMPNPVVPPDCTSLVNGGGGGWGGIPFVAVFIGGGFTPNCQKSNSKQPYLRGIEEGWGGSFGGFGGMGMTVTCCSTPQATTMSFTTGYKPATSGAPVFNTWQTGPDCH